MPADGLARAHGLGHLGQHLRVAVDHAREVHHLSQPDDPGPAHGLGHVLGADLEACGFQPRRRGRAGRHLGEDVHGLQQRLVVHHPHTFQPKNVGDLVGVGEDGGGAVGDDGSAELGRGQHAAFDMHVAVAQAGDDVAPTGVDHLGLRADAVAGVGADVGEAAGGNRNLPAVEHFAALHVDHLAPADNQVGGAAPGGDGDQTRGALGPCVEGGRGGGGLRGAWGGVLGGAHALGFPAGPRLNRSRLSAA